MLSSILIQHFFNQMKKRIGSSLLHPRQGSSQSMSSHCIWDDIYNSIDCITVSIYGLLIVMYEFHGVLFCV